MSDEADSGDAGSISVSVEILDKEYMVACPPDEREALLESARMLNERVRQVRDGGKVLGTERMVVITALNLIHELTRRDRDREAAFERAGVEVQRLAEKARLAAGRRTAGAEVD